MPSDYDWSDLLRLFQIPDQPVFVLGCFARHVTVYSQQVRALNLVSALRRNGFLEKGQKIIVIGGGAAGLTAAAATAYCGARVRVLDQLDGPMELQRNNRQRWLHPHIYDWPSTDKVGPEAQLPLLTWRAGYASDVAEQIFQQWRRLEADLRDAAGPLIHASWSAANIGVKRDGNGVEVTWNERDANCSEFASLAIMAVGFGLEPEDETHDSYWAEDQLDGSFRRPSEPKQWFVSGAGDGGLTDVMRLCIRRFRHHEVAEIFSGIAGIEELKKELEAIHKEDDRKHDPKRVHERFCALLDLRRLPGVPPTPQPWDTLTKEFEKRAILRSGLPVKLASTSSAIYGPESSILNRLIVSQLDKLGRVTVLPDETEKVRYSKGKYVVKLKNRKPFTVDYAILRHGPKSALEEGFPTIWKQSAALRTMWKGRGMNRDNTRLRLWDPGEFGLETSAPLNASSYSDDPTGSGVRAGRWLISKELREDGSSHIKYEIQGLSVARGALRGMHCSISATAGSVGEPVLDEDANRLGMYWEQERKAAPAYVEGARNWARQISRILHFKTDLTADDTPLNFGFSVSLLNGDALSNWEFDQMYYRDKERTHFDGDDLAGSEFLARFVWFPIDELVIRITLPPTITSLPSLSVFTCPAKLEETDVILDGILQLMPLKNSLHPSISNWPRSHEIALRDAQYLKNPSPRTWELKVPRPLVGSCYSLDWALPERTPDKAFRRLIAEAGEFRTRCLLHGDARRNGQPGDTEVHRSFVELAEHLKGLYKIPKNADEAFEVSLMTYDESKHELITFEGMVSDEDRMREKLGRIRFPFGLGLAGTAFKECDKVHMFKRAAAPGAARSSRYVPLAESEAHEVLLSIPFEHPATLGLPEEVWDTVDRPRTCLGILNLGSDQQKSPLKSLTGAEILLLRDLCQRFAADFFNRTAIK